MKCSELIKVIGNFSTFIQCGYMRGDKYFKTGIMRAGNVTMRHIDRWDYKKHIGGVFPRVDKTGKEYLFINLFDD